VGDERSYACTGCGAEGERLICDGLCACCALRDRLTRVIRGDGAGSGAQLLPLIDLLCTPQRAHAAFVWLSAKENAEAIGHLAAIPAPLGHQALAPGSSRRRRAYLRRLLVEAGFLPPRDERLAQLDDWARRRMAHAPATHAYLVRPYTVWSVLRRARQRSERKNLSEGAANWGRIRVNAALDLLGWLDVHHIAFADADQNDIDRYLTSGSTLRYEARHFLRWATARALTADLRIPQRPKLAACARDSGAQERRRALHHLWDSAAIPLDIRVAGSLVLLFGQHVSRVCDLAVDHVTALGGTVMITLDRCPVPLPVPLAALTLQLRARSAALPGRPAGTWTSPPLFPGRPSGHPVSAVVLRRRLAAYGIKARPARNTALAQFAADLPAAVLADVLGLHINTAIQWSRMAQRDWSLYLQARTETTGSAPQ
jgi:hypothetical protein